MTGLEYALLYISAGLEVVPIHNRKKIPITPNGFHDASSNEKIIEAWWKGNPQAGVGIKIPDGIIVVDIDDPNGLGNLNGFGYTLPDTLVCNTGSGGYHYWYKLSDTTKIKTRKIGLFPKVDFLVNGYLVAPPSIHPDGGTYKWDGEFNLGKLSNAPQWIEDIIFSEHTKYAKDKVEPDGILSGVPEGSRDTALFRYICYLRGQRNLTQKEAEALVEIAAKNCKPAFSAEEGREKVRRVWKSYPSYVVDEPKVFQLAELFKADLPSPKYLVWDTTKKGKIRGILPGGLTVISSLPKAGKSALMATMAGAIAKGEKLWDRYDTKQTSVLYLDLEQDATFAVERWRSILEIESIEEVPPELYVSFKWPRMDEGGLDKLKKFLESNTQIGVVVIDTLGDFWPMKMAGDGNAYNKEQFVMLPLHQFAVDYGITLVLVHHDSKGSSNSGPTVKKASGTMAITGKAQAVYHLSSENPKKDSSGVKMQEETFELRGKNIPHRDIELIFYPETFQFEIVNDNI